MKEVILLVGIFFVNIFPFICKAFGGSLLVFQKCIEVGNGIDGFLPFISDIDWKFFLPGIKEILM